MTFRRYAMRTTLVALPALALARCGGDSGPTGGIPRDGALSGVITASEAFSPGVSPVGAAVVGVSPAILAARIRVADTAQRDAIAAALRQDPAIVAVTRNRLLWLDETARAFRATAAAAAARTVPNDPDYPFQAWHYGLIDLPRAWSITKGSSAVLVAVVDDGIRFDHPAIAANLTPDGYDFVSAADSVPLCSGGMISNAADGDGPDPDPTIPASYSLRSEEHTSELQSRLHLVCRLLLEKKKTNH